MDKAEQLLRKILLEGDYATLCRFDRPGKFPAYLHVESYIDLTEEEYQYLGELKHQGESSD